MLVVDICPGQDVKRYLVVCDLITERFFRSPGSKTKYFERFIFFSIINFFTNLSINFKYFKTLTCV